MVGWGPRVFTPTSGGAADNLTYPGNTSAPDPAYSVYNEISAVVANVWTDILTYVVPVSPIIHIVRIEFGGENISKYRILAGASVMASYITWFNGGGLTGEWNFANADGGGIFLASGTVIKVQTNHRRIGMPADFFARLQYREIN